MINSGIYLIHNLFNGRVYIGSTMNLNKRWKSHLSVLERRCHKNQHLQRAWDKYGEREFEFKVLVRCDIDALLHYEQRAIDIYTETLGWENLYNTCSVAGSNLGVKFSPEARANVSKAAKGRQLPATLIDNHRRGRKLSPEHKANISTGGKGRKLSPEHVAKLTAWHKGRKRSLETREKMSAADKGRPSSMLGKKHSPEARAKMSESRKNAWQLGHYQNRKARARLSNDTI